MYTLALSLRAADGGVMADPFDPWFAFIHFHVSSGQTQNKDTKTNPALPRIVQNQAESRRLVSDQIKTECAHNRLLTYLKDISLHK